MLRIKNLHASGRRKRNFEGINLEVKAGEIHAIMGPNGSGKSTLASVLAGNENYEVTGGEVEFEGKDLLEMAPEDRAREGVFLAFQYPVEIPGVSNINFLRTALNEIRTYQKSAGTGIKRIFEIESRKNKSWLSLMQSW